MYVSQSPSHSASSPCGSCVCVSVCVSVCVWCLQVLGVATAGRKVSFYQTHSKAAPEHKLTFNTHHTQDITSLCLPTFPYLPASMFVVTCASQTDQEVRVFSVKGKLLQQLKPSCGRHNRVAVNRDASLLAVAGSSTEARVRLMAVHVACRGAVCCPVTCGVLC